MLATTCYRASRFLAIVRATARNSLSRPALGSHVNAEVNIVCLRANYLSCFWEARGAWKSLVAQGPFTARTSGARGTSDPETADPDELAYWSALSDMVRPGSETAPVRVSPLPSPPQEGTAFHLSAA